MKTLDFGRLRLGAALILFPLLFASCNLQKQITALANMAKCTYKIDNLTGMTLANVNVQGKSSLAQLNLSDATKLATAYLGGTMPLSMTLNMAVKNPNKEPAAMNKLKYILALDGQNLTNGTIPNSFAVEANSTNTLPIQVNVDLKQVLAGKSKEEILNLILALSGQSQKPTKLGLSIKPTFNIAGQAIEYPNYFNVATEFGAGKVQ